MRVTYAIAFVSDMDRSVAFYRDLVGLPLKFQSPKWTEFATEGATFALHPTDIQRGSGDKPAGSCHPGFSTTDLMAVHQRMLAAGVTVTRAPENVHGMLMAQYLDPDGLDFSVSEAPDEAHPRE